MRFAFRSAAFCVLVAALLTINAPADQAAPGNTGAPGGAADVILAQPQLVRIAATVDGSGHIVFTRAKATYEHKHWAPPTQVHFDGIPWLNLETTPPTWADYSSQLDLTKAWIVKRTGRDVVALEHTPDGFDLYLSDSPNEAANYEITIAIPRRQ